MPVSINQTKKRIASIQSTKKITNAMKLVSIAKLKSSQNRLLGQVVFANKIDLVMEKLSLLGNASSPYFANEDYQSNNKLFIAITSDLGLCGSYNYNIFNFLDELMLNNKDAHYLILGNKGINHYLNQKFNKDLELDGTSVNNIDKLATQIKNYVLSSYENKKYDEIHLIYTKFINSLNFKVEDKIILPIKNLNTNNDDFYLKIPPIVEPNKDEVINSLIPLYVESIIYSNLLSSVVSEQSSRRNAMEKASDNASELLDKLTNEFNKARQESITNEIIEVVSAFNNV